MTSTRCPCGSGDTYADCCGRFHAGVAVAPTAEALMRSRYSAFVVGDADYLLATWYATTRPDALDLAGGPQWRRLEILGTVDGGPFDTAGVVEFRAYYRGAAGRGVMHERSTFTREGGRWFYVAGEVAPAGR